jgi:hypothetical protein
MFTSSVKLKKVLRPRLISQQSEKINEEARQIEKERRDMPTVTYGNTTPSTPVHFYYIAPLITLLLSILGTMENNGLFKCFLIHQFHDFNALIP